MSKHKSEDFKISAVNYYLDNDVSMDYVCNIFNCKKPSLTRIFKLVCGQNAKTLLVFSKEPNNIAAYPPLEIPQK